MLLAGGAPLAYMPTSTHTELCVTPAMVTVDSTPHALSSPPARQPKLAGVSGMP